MTAALLRVYDPDECDEHGVPLDWERCRTCDGEGMFEASDPIGAALSEGRRCSTCGGHGSLKAAALAACVDRGAATIHKAAAVGPATWGPRLTVRCEGCGHPMSVGTWEEDRGHFFNPAWASAAAQVALREGREPYANWEHGSGGRHVHWSPCDAGCRHSGPGRVREAESGMLLPQDELATAIALLRDPGYPRRRVLSSVEASWRAVDVRTLGWPHDLRPEKLAVLCLRCWAERNES